MRRVLAVASLLLVVVTADRVRRRAEFVGAAGDRHGGPARSAEPAHARPPAWIPTCCCANSSRRLPIPRTGISPRASSSPSRRRRSWDDAGSALLIDRVVFVETRGPDRVSVTHAGRHPRLAVRHGRVRDRRGRAARPRSDRPGEDRRAVGASTGCPTGCSWTGNSSRRPTSATPCTSWTPPARPWCPTRATSRCPTPTSWPPNWSPSWSPVRARRWTNTVRNLLGPPLRLRGPVTRADGGKTGVGRGYGGARIDLENLSTTDPHSRQLLAAQIIWTLSRAGINGPYVINADGAALDDRFAEGWNTSDVAATDPGADPGAAAGLHALVGGSLVSLDGQKAPRVPGSFGQMPDQTSATLSRSGQEVGVGGDATAGRARHGVVAVGRPGGRRRGPGPGRAHAVAADVGRSTTRSGSSSTATTSCGSSRRPPPGSRRGFPSTPPPCRRDSPGRSPSCSCRATARARRW